MGVRLIREIDDAARRGRFAVEAKWSRVLLIAALALTPAILSALAYASPRAPPTRSARLAV